LALHFHARGACRLSICPQNTPFPLDCLSAMKQFDDLESCSEMRVESYATAESSHCVKEMSTNHEKWRQLLGGPEIQWLPIR
jgi:hypothetical protein